MSVWISLMLASVTAVAAWFSRHPAAGWFAVAVQVGAFVALGDSADWGIGAAAVGMTMGAALRREGGWLLASCGLLLVWGLAPPVRAAALPADLALLAAVGAGSVVTATVLASRTASGALMAAGAALAASSLVGRDVTGLRGGSWPVTTLDGTLVHDMAPSGASSELAWMSLGPASWAIWAVVLLVVLRFVGAAYRPSIGSRLWSHGIGGVAVLAAMLVAMAGLQPWTAAATGASGLGWELVVSSGRVLMPPSGPYQASAVHVVAALAGLIAVAIGSWLPGRFGGDRPSDGARFWMVAALVGVSASWALDSQTLAHPWSRDALAPLSMVVFAGVTGARLLAGSSAVVDLLVGTITGLTLFFVIAGGA